MPDFESLEALDKYYKKAIKDAGDDADAVKGLELEQREARADLREVLAQRRELDAHRTQAIAAAGIPADFAEFVTGNSAEEIDASAAKIKERVGKLTANAGDGAGAAAYGDPAANGAGAPPPPQLSPSRKFEEDFANRYNNREQVSKAEIDKFVQQRLGRKVITDFKERGLARYRDFDLSKLK